MHSISQTPGGSFFVKAMPCRWLFPVDAFVDVVRRYMHMCILPLEEPKPGGDIQFERLPNPKHLAWATSSDVVSGDTPLVHVLGQENKTDFIPTSLANTDN